MALRPTRHVVAAGALVVLALTISSIILVHQEHETLFRLLHPGESAPPTAVFSRWLPLDPRAPVSWNRVTKWLAALEYRAVSNAPAGPGEYYAAYPDLSVFAHSFRYPDKDMPAQLMNLRFSVRGLERIEAVAGRAALPDWRL